MKFNYEFKKLIPNSRFLIHFLLMVMSIMLFNCTQYPKETENNRSLDMQLVWNIKSEDKGEGSLLSIKSLYDEIQKAGVTTVEMIAKADGQVIMEKTFPFEQRTGKLSNLPAKLITGIAEARDKNGKAFFRGTQDVDLRYGSQRTKVVMNEIGAPTAPTVIASGTKQSSLEIEMVSYQFSDECLYNLNV